MNILFVAPCFPGRVSEYLILPSLELCISSAILKQNRHRVKLLDMKIDHLTVESAISRLRQDVFVPDLICVDDTPEVHCTTKRLLPLLKALYGDGTLITLRGEIGSFCPEMVLARNPALDVVFRFDDDYALPRVLEQLENGLDGFASIPNIAYRSGGEIKVTPTARRGYKLDSLPYPDRHLYDIEKYLHRDSETIVRSTRGCPGNCLFCIKTRYEQFGLFSVSRFADEIEQLQKMGFASFFFSDDTFAFSDERLAEFAAEVKRRDLKLRFTSNIRIKDINEYKIRTLKELGAYRVFVGIETINARSSAILNKNLEQEEIRRKLAILHQYGMEFHASFILGSPNDTPEDLEATIDFVKEIKPTIVTFNLIKAYPGLPIYEDPEAFGIIMEDPYWFEKDEWSRKCVIGTKNLPPEALEKWSRRMLFEFITG